MPVSLVFATLLLVGVGIVGVLAIVGLVLLLVRRAPSALAPDSDA